VTARVLETSQIARSAMQLAIAADELATAQRWLAAGDGDVLVVQEFGARLFDSLFTGTVRMLYDDLTAESGHAPALWLVIDDIGVAQIPWELLYDRRQPDLVALRSPIVRGATVATPAAMRPIDAGPLRVLVATAFPSGLEMLQGHTETQSIASALDDQAGGAQITDLPHATVSRLQNALREAEQRGAPYHGLHLICHGYVDPATGASVLLLEDENGDAEVVDPSGLATLLRGHGLRLVFLNACNSASVPINNLAPGFAQALLGACIPMLVGMQAPVVEVDALRFTAEFYASLADGRSVDAALLDVRRIAHQRSAGGSAALAIPVCFTRIMPAQLINPSISPPEGVWWRQLWKVAAATAVLLVGLIGGYLTVRDFLCRAPLRAGLPAVIGGACDVLAPEPPPVVIVPTVTPAPQLTGDFKIAVAEFAVVDDTGQTAPNLKGGELAHHLYTALKADLEQRMDSSTPFVIGATLAPHDVGVIEGDSYETQVDNAVRRGRELNADLLIFGNLGISPDKTVADIYFYLAPTQLHAAEEMAGNYLLMDRVEIDGNLLNNAVTNSELRNRLLSQSGGLADFIFGIGFFNRQQYLEASRWLDSAKQSFRFSSIRDKLIAMNCSNFQPQAPCELIQITGIQGADCAFVPAPLPSDSALMSCPFLRLALFWLVGLVVLAPAQATQVA
jgi:hypothetical protein